MMNHAILYRPNKRWQMWAAFAYAVVIHVAAVAMSEDRSKPPSVVVCVFPGDEVQGTDDPVEAPPQSDMSIPEQLVVPSPDDMFRDDNSTPPLHRRVRPIATVAKLGDSGTTSSASFRSVRGLTLSAPRPEYPYEARSRRITGSGAAAVKIDPASGSVIDVRMSQSTGNAILDNATVSAFRRWRFKPKTVSNVQVPITYTLTGAFY